MIGLGSHWALGPTCLSSAGLRTRRRRLVCDGAVVPAAAVSALFALVDATYPRIARQGPTIGPLIGRLILTATGLAGIGFTVIGALALANSHYLGGDCRTSSRRRLPQIYSLIWALNVPAHILVLQAMASGGHRILVPVVFGEALVELPSQRRAGIHRHPDRPRTRHARDSRLIESRDHPLADATARRRQRRDGRLQVR